MRDNLIRLLLLVTVVGATPRARAAKTQEHPKFDYRAIVQAYMPEYPHGAREAHITGTGVVVVVIDRSTGNVVSCHMDPSTGNDELDEAALQAFRNGDSSQALTPG